MRSCQNTCFEHFCGSVFSEKSSQIAGKKHRTCRANLVPRRIFVHRRGAPRGVLCLSFSNEARSAFSFVKKRVFSTVPSPRVAHAPPGGPQITPGCTIFLIFSKGFCDFAEKPSQLSSKMPIGGPAGAHPSKKGRQSRQNGGSEKNLLRSAVECPFSSRLLRKRPFRARVVKAKVVLHGKIDRFGHTPDQNGHSVRER